MKNRKDKRFYSTIESTCLCEVICNDHLLKIWNSNLNEKTITHTDSRFFL